MLAAGLVLSGRSRDANLYPANLQAGTQLVKAKFTDSGMGNGPVEVTMPYGEVLKGQFSTTDTSSYRLGSAFASAGSMPGVVTAIGPSGTTIRCEYQVNTFASSDTGACQTGKGAVYDLHF